MLNSHLLNVFWNFGEAEKRCLRLFLMVDLRGWRGEYEEDRSSTTPEGTVRRLTTAQRLVTVVSGIL